MKRGLRIMAKSPNYITPEGFTALQEEFKKLFHNERPKLVETIAWAAGNGDRSENADYTYGKRRLREIDKRLHWLRNRIESARIVDPKTLQSAKVVFGATVTVVTEDDERKTYQIVGEDEIDIAKNRISWKSPIAKALLGKECGSEVEIQRPAGSVYVEIVEIQFK